MNTHDLDFARKIAEWWNSPDIRENTIPTLIWYECSFHAIEYAHEDKEYRPRHYFSEADQHTINMLWYRLVDNNPEIFNRGLAEKRKRLETKGREIWGGTPTCTELPSLPSLPPHLPPGSYVVSRNTIPGWNCADME
jgi:hypothetical protein